MPSPHDATSATAATHRHALLLAFTVAPGCIALPFATPPVRASFTVSGLSAARRDAAVAVV
ncbi:MAG: hypothetical protein U0326_34525 [Polyangiales bacterium]